MVDVTEEEIRYLQRIVAQAMTVARSSPHNRSARDALNIEDLRTTLAEMPESLLSRWTNLGRRKGDVDEARGKR